MSSSYIKSMPTTDEYREGWDRVFGGKRAAEPPTAELRCKCRGLPVLMLDDMCQLMCQKCKTRCVSWRELRERRVKGLPSWPK